MYPQTIIIVSHIYGIFANAVKRCHENRQSPFLFLHACTHTFAPKRVHFSIFWCYAYITNTGKANSWRWVAWDDNSGNGWRTYISGTEFAPSIWTETNNSEFETRNQVALIIFLLIIRLLIQLNNRHIHRICTSYPLGQHAIYIHQLCHDSGL